MLEERMKRAVSRERKEGRVEVREEFEAFLTREEVESSQRKVRI